MYNPVFKTLQQEGRVKSPVFPLDGIQAKMYSQKAQVNNYKILFAIGSRYHAFVARVCPEQVCNHYHYCAAFTFPRSQVYLEADTPKALEVGLWSIRLQYHASTRSFRAPNGFFLVEEPELRNDCRIWHFATKKELGRV